ncbi:MAG: DUF4406 domain-containing protein [Elusimicrobiota bacterium]
MRRPRIYVAGPYTLGDSVLNVRAAILVADELWQLGYAPFIPHETMLWHLVAPKSYEEWMTIDREWLGACDAVFRLPGESKGADREVEDARSRGLPVHFTISSLVDDPRLDPKKFTVSGWEELLRESEAFFGHVEPIMDGRRVPGPQNWYVLLTRAVSLIGRLGVAVRAARP